MVCSAGWASSTAAQAKPSQTPSASEYRKCRSAALDDGLDEFRAAQRCVPSGPKFILCMGSARPQTARLIRCVNAQVPGAYPGDRLPVVPVDPDPAPTSDPGASSTTEAEEGTTTTSPATTTSVSTTNEPTVSPGGGSPMGPAVEETNGGSSGDDGFGFGVVLVVGIVGLACGLGAGVVLGRRGQPASDISVGLPRSAPAPVVPLGPPPSPRAGPGMTDPVRVAPGSTGSGPFPVAPDVGSPAAAPVVEQGREPDPDRGALIEALIEVADEVSSGAVRTAIVQRLAAVGVEAIVVEAGTPFDASRHRGIHAEQATSAEQADTVVAMERPGWVDRGKVLRPPEVVVYRWEGGEG